MPDRRPSGLMAVMRKEVRQTFRDRRMTAILLVAPVVQLVLLGYAVDLDVDRIRTAVCDRDRTAESRRLARALLADGTLRAIGAVDRPERPLLEGAASAVIVLPRGLAADLARGRAAKVQILVDGTDPLQGQAADAFPSRLLFLRALQRAVDQARLRAATGAAAGQLSVERPSIGAGVGGPATGAIQLAPRVLFNPSMKSPVYMVPGVAAIILLVITTVITAMGIAREREMGTIEQLMITPLKPSVLLLGKILPFAVIGLVVTGLVLAVGTHLFGVPMRGSLAVLFVGTLLYLLTTLGAGVLISTVSRTQQQAILGGFFFILPAILLSGFATPVQSMPEWIRPVIYANPVYYYVLLLRANLLKGAGFVDLGLPLGGLLLFGVVIFAMAAWRFRKQHG